MAQEHGRWLVLLERRLLIRLERRVVAERRPQLGAGRRPAFAMRWSRTAAGVGALALLLAVFGVRAIVAGSVAERQREMGVRLALGATPRGVMRLVVGEAGAMAWAGGLFGLALAAASARLLAAQLHGLDAADVWPTIGLVGGAVALAAVSAALPAALRAASVDPARVLQRE